MNPEPAQPSNDAKRCGACTWSRCGQVVVVDPFPGSAASAAFQALFCYRERPRERVDPNGFCPDFQARPPA